MADNTGRDRSNERERTRGRGRGAFIQYYDDMGTSSTEEGHTAFVGAKSSWEQKIAAAQSKYNQAQSQVNTAKSQYSQAAGEVNRATGEYNAGVAEIGNIRADVPEFGSGFTPIRVTNGNNVEGIYKVPATQEALKVLKDAGFNAGFVDGGKNFNVDVRVKGHVMGQELHDIMREAEAASRADYERQKALANAQAAAVRAKASQQAAAVKSQIEQYRSILQGKASEIAQAQSQVDSFGDQIKGSKQSMSKELSMIKEDYKNKLQTVREVLLGTKTELGKTEPKAEGLADVIPDVVKESLDNDQVPPDIILSNGELDPMKIALLEQVLLKRKEGGDGSTKEDTSKGQFEGSLNYG